jgi:AcrR family transcriptional regulator
LAADEEEQDRGMSPRPQIDHIRRPQLLAAAAEVISERGFDATRIADVADRAGTSPSAILYWFESRDELLAEALIADENRFDEDLSTRLARLDSPSARLLELLEASANEYDWTLWIELWTRALRDPSVRAARERLDDRWRATLARIVTAGAKSGEFAPEDVDGAAHTLASLIDGLAVQVTLSDGTMPQERMLELSVIAANSLLNVDLQLGAASGRPTATQEVR